MGQLSVPEKLRQHRKCSGSERLVDERLLPVQGFDGRTAWQGSSPSSASVISGNSSLTVRSRFALRRPHAFSGCPRTNWQFAALLPRSIVGTT